MHSAFDYCTAYLRQQVLKGWRVHGLWKAGYHIQHTGSKYMRMSLQEHLQLCYSTRSGKGFSCSLYQAVPELAECLWERGPGRHTYQPANSM